MNKLKINNTKIDDEKIINGEFEITKEMEDELSNNKGEDN